MRRKAASLGLVALLALCPVSGAGCAYKYTFKTQRPPDPERRVEEWRHIGLWGWIGAAPFDVRKAGPGGAAEFGSYVSFGNWICAFLTIGLYSPRTVYAMPARDGEGGVAPDRGVERDGRKNRRTRP